MAMQEWRSRSAEDWFARHLSEDLSEEERDYFAQWLRDPVNAKNYEETGAAWEQAKFAKAYFNKQTVTPEQTKSSSSRYRWPLALAATIILGISLTLSLTGNKPEYSELLTTRIGERQEHLLPDGSAIELGVNSKLSVEFSNEARNVELYGGEAYFKVATDKSRRFNIATNGYRISVVGTEFNVKARGRSTEVLLVEGAVSVEPEQPKSTKPLLLKAGQQVTFAPNKPLGKPQTGNPNITLAWRSGKAVYNNTPLREVVRNFKLYHSRQITIDPSAATLRVSGVIPIEDYEIAMSTLGALLPVSIEPAADGHIIRSAP